MTFGRVQNTMKRQALLAMASIAKPRIGLVSSYDPATYAVKVRLMPEDVETGWCPLGTIRAGNGFGFYCPPAIGDQAVVIFQEGAVESGVVISMLYSDADRPLPVPAGEIWAAHEGGASLKFKADGVVELVAPGGLDITADTTITGNVLVSGDVTDQTAGGNDKTVKQLRDAYNAAKYPVLAVGFPTGTTDHPVA